MRKSLLGIALLIALLAVSVPAAFAEPIMTLALPGLGLLDVNAAQTVSFDAVTDWENYASPTGSSLAVETGVYRAYTPGSGYLWGLEGQSHENVVLEVEVTPLTIFTDTAAGVMCRADEANNGDGYYFMINGNGFYSIRVGRGDGIAPLVDWQPSSAVRTGIDRNVIRAVCMNDILAMYVNGELVAYVEDQTYHSGTSGLAVAGGMYGVDMSFDNANIYDVSFSALVDGNSL
jgi:hypothetical protein